EPAEDAVSIVLTRREQEIARMAAQGLTDREIAEALVVSVRTVESHLAAAYRKLGIRSRRELAGLLAAR
ncbi:MAG TPA: helix-turn-helix transcriptional regulator, partial [Mycobacteriales bacterium]|nr:helix-turn-helix transcriptional regulator [Mycobacteriales bacterium]